MVRTVQGRFDEAETLFAEAIPPLSGATLEFHTAMRSACGGAVARRAGEAGAAAALGEALEFCTGSEWLGAEHPFTKWCTEELAAAAPAVTAAQEPEDVT